MDVKSRIILEIDNLLSEYEEKRTEEENSVWTFPDEEGREKDFHAILGAIDALEFLKKQIGGIDIASHTILPIVEEPSSAVIRRPPSFLNEVLLWIDETLKLKLIHGNPGSGANPNAMPGREESCMRIKRFVYDLHDELMDNS